MEVTREQYQDEVKRFWSKKCEELKAENKKLQKQADLLTLGLLQEKTRTCNWQYIDGAAYQTQCGIRLCPVGATTVVKSKYKYCQNCGGKITAQALKQDK